MYIFMLNWVTIRPYSPGNNNLPPLDDLNPIRGLPATIVNVCLLPLIIYTFARSTGGHVNPIITLAAYFTREISPYRTVLYLTGQAMGGILAGWATRKAYGGTDFLVRGCAFSAVPSRNAYFIETISCFALLAAIVRATTNQKPRTMFHNTLSPWVVGIATEGACWVSRLIWQAYPGAGMSS